MSSTEKLTGLFKYFHPVFFWCFTNKVEFIKPEEQRNGKKQPFLLNLGGKKDQLNQFNIEMKAYKYVDIKEPIREWLEVDWNGMDFG